MSRYILIHRLRGPAILLLIGVMALLYQSGAISYFWELFLPLLLILIGVLMLAERVALAAEGDQLFPGGRYWGAANQGGGQGAPESAGTAIVPAQKHELENELDRGER